MNLKFEQVMKMSEQKRDKLLECKHGKLVEMLIMSSKSPRPWEDMIENLEAAIAKYSKSFSIKELPSAATAYTYRDRVAHLLKMYEIIEDVSSSENIESHLRKVS